MKKLLGFCLVFCVVGQSAGMEFFKRESERVLDLSWCKDKYEVYDALKKEREDYEFAKRNCMGKRPRRYIKWIKLPNTETIKWKMFCHLCLGRPTAWVDCSRCTIDTDSFDNLSQDALGVDLSNALCSESNSLIGDNGVKRLWFSSSHKPHRNAKKHLIELYLRNLNVTDKLLIDGFPTKNLVILDLGHTKITNDGLPHLANFKNLERLCLDGCKITSLSALTKMESLKHLSICECLGIKYTALLPLGANNNNLKLETLHMSGCKTVGSRGLGIFLSQYGMRTKADNLKELKLDFCAVSDEILFALTLFKNLKKLSLRGCWELNLQKIETILKMPNLVELCLSSTDLEELHDLKNYVKTEFKDRNGTAFIIEVARIRSDLQQPTQNPVLYLPPRHVQYPAFPQDNWSTCGNYGNHEDYDWSTFENHGMNTWVPNKIQKD